jgi:hypothetical protein
MSPFTAKRMQVPDVLQIALKDETSTLVLIPHAGSMRAQTLRVPVGDAGDVAIVETATVVVILFAFVYLLRQLCGRLALSVWLLRYPRQKKTVRFPV